MIVKIIKVGYALESELEFKADCTVTLVEAGEYRILFDTGGSRDAKSLKNIGNITHVCSSPDGHIIMIICPSGLLHTEIALDMSGSWTSSGHHNLTLKHS